MATAWNPIALVVEDDPDVREIAVVLFEESDLRVIPCTSAEAAFSAMCKHGGDVAIMFADVRLAGLMDGVDLAHRVKRMWPHVKIVLTSGHPASRSNALPADAVYMPKPWLALDVLVQAEKAAASHR